MVFENILNLIFSPLLKIPTLWAVIALSFLISLIITVVYKFTTDQNLMKQLKGEMKELQKEMKELRNHPEKAMEVNKRFMNTNKKYMFQSFKSTIYSIVPILLIFGWMNANFAYEPILPWQEFTTTVVVKNFDEKIELSVPEGMKISSDAIKEVKDSEVKWVLSGEKGEYLLEYIIDGDEETKEVLITTEHKYKKVDKTKKPFLSFFSPPESYISEGSSIELIRIDNKPKKVLNLFGLKLSWLWTYIIFSIIFSILIRKIVKVY